MRIFYIIFLFFMISQRPLQGSMQSLDDLVGKIIEFSPLSIDKNAQLAFSYLEHLDLQSMQLKVFLLKRETVFEKNYTLDRDFILLHAKAVKTSRYPFLKKILNKNKKLQSDTFKKIMEIFEISARNSLTESVSPLILNTPILQSRKKEKKSWQDIFGIFCSPYKDDEDGYEDDFSWRQNILSDEF